MSQHALPMDDLPLQGPIPLGPDEPELFADALRRIVRHLELEPAPATRRGRRRAATTTTAAVAAGPTGELPVRRPGPNALPTRASIRR